MKKEREREGGKREGSIDRTRPLQDRINVKKYNLRDNEQDPVYSFPRYISLSILKHYLEFLWLFDSLSLSLFPSRPMYWVTQNTWLNNRFPRIISSPLKGFFDQRKFSLGNSSNFPSKLVVEKNANERTVLEINYHAH